MKKSLIALAAMSAVAGAAQAQSSVSVYGIIDSGYLSTESTGVRSSTNASQTVTDSAGITSSASSSSRLGFRGTEDLGGGLRAEFVVETGLNATNSTVSTFNNRQSFIGLSSAKAGTFRIGTQYTAHHNLAAAFSPTTGVNMAGDLNYTTGPVTSGALTNLGIAGGIAAGTAATTAAAISSSLAADGTLASANVAAVNKAANIILANAGLNNGIVNAAGNDWMAAPSGGATGAPTSGTVVAFIEGSDAESLAGNLKVINIMSTYIRDYTRAVTNTRLGLADMNGYTVRRNNTISYASPVMNGFQLGLGYNAPTTTKIEGGSETKASSQTISLSYTSGKFAAAAAHASGKSEAITVNYATSANNSAQQVLSTITAPDHATNAPALTQSLAVGVLAQDARLTPRVEVKGQETMAAASYDLGVAKLGYIYSSKKAKDTMSDIIDRQSHSFNISAPLSAKVTAWANYADGKQDVLVTNKYDLKAMQVGARYNFSKRTDVYAIYGQTKMDRKDSAVDLKDTQYAVGLRHSF